MSRKRNERLCDCPKCIDPGHPGGKLVSATTYRSHQERLPFLNAAKQYPRIRLIVNPPVVQRETTFTLTPEQEMYAASTSTVERRDEPMERTGEISGENWDQDEDLRDFGTSGSDYGDLYIDPMDVDATPADLHAHRPPQEADSSESGSTGSEETPGSPQEADSPDASISDLGDDRDKPFRFDVSDSPRPAREIFDFMPAKPFWKPFLLGVSYINLHFHATHRACNLLLGMAKIVLTHLGHFDRTDKPITTLRTSFNAIGLKELFLILPMCPLCHRIYPADSPVVLRCYKCMQPLFNSRTTLLANFDGSDKTTKDIISIPLLKCPFYPLSAQIPALVCRFEKELEDSLQVEPMDGVLRDIRDGQLWKEARAKDGSSFFSPSDPSAIRIGLILHFDGFGGERSQKGPTYSSGVLSYSVINLPVHLRYKPNNLLVVALSPGPKESSCDELQHLLEAVVDDKIRLYEEGIEVKTPLHPNGRKVHVYCIADGCDHPAMCRVVGKADHSHLKFFCTRCKIPRQDLNSMDGITGLMKTYEPRTGDEHRRLAKRYRDAEPGDEPGQCEDLFKKNGTRYYAMSRLKYFDAVRMSAIDPMHNVLLGLCKRQWLDVWVRGGVLRERTRLKVRELDQIHAYLSSFEMPSWVGRLPNQVGYPAGGSLSADEYKALVLAFCPVVIPLIWREWQPLAQAEFNKALEKWEASERDPTVQKYERPKLRMHPDDAENFLKLAAALKIVLGRTIRLTDLDRAERLLKEYLEGFLVMHPLHVKPNHHWVLHLFDQLRDLGPVYGFWTFTGERLNKVLKSFKTNNHNGGEIETSFMRAFCRDLTLRDTLRSLVSEPAEDDCGLMDVAKLLLTEDTDTRGTVASMNLVNQEVEERTRETLLGHGTPSLGAGVVRTLQRELQNTLLEFYGEMYPQANICAPSDRSRTDGRRISASTSAKRASNSIIQMEFDDQIYVGQVISIIRHSQLRIGHPIIFVHVLWFRKSQDVDTNIWDEFPELEIFFWKYNDYLHPGEPGPPRVITTDHIKSQAARATVMTRPPRCSDDEEESEPMPLWVTVGLSRENIVI
ncbi:hypothetical protein ACEPAI_6682 [Sanghuangporus weigelae]